METDIQLKKPDVANGLNRTMQYGNLECQIYEVKKMVKFKSYYVVWKPDSAGFFAIIPKSLNRTMQYGNQVSLHQLYIPFFRFKSYYVVWKLCSDINNLMSY